MTASNILKGIRKKHGLTQEKMSKLLDMTRQNYNYLENNPLKASLDKLFCIFELLNEDIDDFLLAIEQDYLSRQDK